MILRATELDGGPEITSGLTWTVKPAGGDAVFNAADAGVVETEIAPGAYVVTVARASDGSKGESQARSTRGGRRAR